MADAPILNYTTSITATKSAGEVQDLLGRAGASTVAVTYESGRPTAVQFVLPTAAGPAGYTLPVQVDAVYRALLKHSAAPRYSTREHAERVAWRIAKDWLEAQIALVRADMASLPQVMLPYRHTDSGDTVWQVEQQRQQLALDAAEADR